MQAFAVANFGETGSVRELPAPEPEQGEVRIRVAAASVNPVDVAVMQGYMKDMMEHRFPLIPGIDASGVVDALGEGVEGWRLGDDAFGAVGKMYFGEGTYAEFATMSARSIAPKPASLDHVEAAAVPLAGVTAVMLLDAVGLREGETILAVGAAGGVGSYLVQLAARRGAQVVAVCRGENADYVRGLGAADVIDYTAGDVAEALRSGYPGRIDAIADLVGDKETVTRLSDQLRPGGRVASAAGGADEEALARRDVKGAYIVTMVTAEHLANLAKALEEGTLKLPQIQRFTLGQAADALALIGSRHVRGKLVLTVA
jgi:NADPH2:quinone reductase